MPRRHHIMVTSNLRRATGEADPLDVQVSMESSPLRTFHVNLIAVWEHWVVEVPDAGGVHAMISDISDAESAACQAIATVLDVDPAHIRVVLPAV